MANLEKFYIPQYNKAGIYAVVNRTKMMLDIIKILLILQHIFAMI